MKNGLAPLPIVKPPGWRGIHFNDMAGQTHPASLLTAVQACEVIVLHRKNMAHATIAKRFNVSISVVRSIVAGRRYARDTAAERAKKDGPTNELGQ